MSTATSSDTSSVDSFFSDLNQSDPSLSLPAPSISVDDHSQPQGTQKRQTNSNPPPSSMNKHNRKRSNSRSRRQPNPSGSSPSYVNSTSPMKSKKIDRSQLQYTVVLTPLNESFEKKSLVIPYFPDVLKLGRPAGTKIQPTPSNGFFDSRVLSRSHAQLYADIDTGKIYIKDLGSSNGTFVNKVKITPDKDGEPTEINEGDVIDLGFDIESHQNHRKISARVEKILIRPLSSVSMIANVSKGNENGIKLMNIDEDVKNSILSNTFDCALFGDVLPGFEEHLLNIKNDSMTGLSINSNLTTSSNLDFQIKTLVDEIYFTKNSILKTKSIEVFLKKYIKNLRKIEIEKNETTKNKVKDYEQQLAKSYEKDYHEKKSEFEKKLAKLTEMNKTIKSENELFVSIIAELNEKSKNIENSLKEEKKQTTTLLTENNKLKNETEEKSQQLNDYQIRLTGLEAAIQEYKQKELIVLEEKGVQTELLPSKKYKNNINDNDSDSSTLNDDDLNLSRITKTFNNRNAGHEQNYSSRLKNTILTNDDISNNTEHNGSSSKDNLLSSTKKNSGNSDNHKTNNNDNKLIIEETGNITDNPTDKSNILTVTNSDEDLNDVRDDRSAIITDDSISEVTDNEAERSLYNSQREILHDNNDYKKLLEQLKSLKEENGQFKNLIIHRDKTINKLESQLKIGHVVVDDHENSWILDPNHANDIGRLSRSPSNLSINSGTSSVGTGISLTSTQTPLLGIFAPGIALRSRNIGASTSSSNDDFEESGVDIDEFDDNHKSRSTLSANNIVSANGTKLAKAESARTSLVTAVGIVIIGLMISRIKG